MCETKRFNMGFDYYMKVVGECSLQDFLKSCQQRLHDNFDDEMIGWGKKWTYELKERQKYFDQISISFYNWEIIVNNWPQLIDFNQNTNNGVITDELIHETEDDSFDTFEEKCYYQMKEYIFLETLLLAIDDKDPNLSQYCLVFNGMDGLSINEEHMINIVIAAMSSYKGNEKLNIDFLEIHQNVQKFINKFPLINVHTLLGQV